MSPGAAAPGGSGPGETGLDEAGLGKAEAGLAALLEACDRAIEDIGPAVPPVQLRALLIIGRSGSLNLNRLARALDSSASATSRLIDRMQAAGLLTRDRASVSRREIVLLPTEAGRRLADWVKSQHRAALTRTLESMSLDGRQALTAGLGELAAIVASGAASRRQSALGRRQPGASRPRRPGRQPGPRSAPAGSGQHRPRPGTAP